MNILYDIILGAGLGILIAAPVGPIVFLCIRRTLQYGLFQGISTGLGAAIADTIYGGIAIIGVATVLQFLTEYENYIRIFGGIILLFLGYKSLRSKITEVRDPSQNHKTISNFFTALLLTLANPATLIILIGIFTTIELGDDESIPTLIYTIVGIFLGATLWWLMVSWGISTLKKKITLASVVKINRFASIIIVGFGIYSFISGIDHLLGFHHIF